MKTQSLKPAVALAAALLAESALGQNPWTVVHEGDRPLNAVAFGDGLFVAVGDSGTVLTSPDGEDWTPRTLPAPADAALQSVVHGGGLWLASGRTAGVLTSPDGIRWAWVPGSPTNLTALAHGNGVFVGVGQRRLWASTDGAKWDWVQRESGVMDRVLAFGGGWFVAKQALSGDRLLASANGTDWVDQPGPSPLNLYSIVYGDRQFLAIDSSNQAFTTSDFESWTPGGWVQGPRPSAAAHGMGVFAVAGGGDPEMSVDGSAWTFDRMSGGRATRGLAYGAGGFVAVNFDGRIRRATNWLFLDTTGPGSLAILGPGGGRYGIEARDSLDAAASWSPVGEVRVGTNAEPWLDPDVSTRSGRFYRAVGP
ncbi:MAG: hypothetical protein J0L84_02765 [Verrucomicrobia bacterium]|nr:hypothetical protein [Verrucomicrobiota bacterium]